MALEIIPDNLRSKYRIEERGHACAILASDFPEQFQDILDCLEAFTLKQSYIVAKGGGKSPVSEAIDGFLQGIVKVRKKKPKRAPTAPIGDPAGRGWKEKKFSIKIEVDGSPIPIPTHKIDNFKDRVGLEVEWNNKTEFYDRDLNNFRLLNDLRVLSVGVLL